MLTSGLWSSALLSTTGAAAQVVEDPPPTFPPSPPVVPFTRRLRIPRPHLPPNRPGATPRQLAKAQAITGFIDEEHVYNRVLTEAEIQTDMNRPLP